MKSIFKIFMVFAASLFLTSCLKNNLPQTANSSLKDISDFNLIYKYTDTIVDDAGTPNENTRIVVSTIQLNKILSISNDTVYVTPQFPSGFPQNQKIKVTLTNIWGMVNIPDAATITPVGNAPKLGTPGDFTAPVSYLVTAADGTTKTWVISVAPLPEVNQYEGDYTSNGYLYHPSDPRSIDNLDKYLATLGPNSVTVDLGDLGSSGYQAVLTVNPDNTVTITAAPGAAGAPYTMFTAGLPTTNPGYTPQWSGSAQCNNTYDPATKTFYVRYGYMGSTGWRVTEEIIKAN